MSLYGKSIYESISLELFENYFNTLSEECRSDSEYILKLASLLERMVGNCIEEIFFKQLDNPHDTGFLKKLSETVIKKYWQNKRMEFIRIMYESARKAKNKSHSTITFDIDAINPGDKKKLSKVQRLRNYIAHNADIAFASEYSEIAKGNEIEDFSKEDFKESIREAIMVLYRLTGLVEEEYIRIEMEELAMEAAYDYDPRD